MVKFKVLQVKRWIPVEEIQDLIVNLGIKNSKRELIGIRAFSKILEESHYKVIRKRKTVNKIKNTYYFIHKI